ncbi:hypothetical protein D3C86_1181740 [compost metagenome]
MNILQFDRLPPTGAPVVHSLAVILLIFHMTIHTFRINSGSIIKLILQCGIRTQRISLSFIISQLQAR